MTLTLWLEQADEWEVVEKGNRAVEITNMYGGRYLLFEDGEVAGQTDSAKEAHNFIANAWYL